MTSELTHPFEEKTLSQEIVYKGQVITMRRDVVMHPSGHETVREVAEHPGGVVVCPIRDDGKIIFVEQWRYPLKRTLLELPAGKLDWTDGVCEEPLKAIQRELWEETGYEADTWEELTYLFAAPGFCDEKLWLYKATNLKNGHKAHQPSDHEWLDVIVLTPDEALHKIRTREIVDAKTVALLLMCFSRY